MTLKNGRGRIEETAVVGTHSTVTTVEEGTALVSALENGIETGRISQGTAGEKFIGIAYTYYTTPTTHTNTETFTSVSTARTFTPARATNVVTGTVSVINASNVALTQITSGSPTASQFLYTAATNLITVHADHDDTLLSVYYRYNLTVAQAIALTGSGDVGIDRIHQLEVVDFVKNGTLYTSNYDTSVNWEVDNPTITLGSNGRFTIGGSGTTLSNARVIETPSTNGEGFLGININY